MLIVTRRPGESLIIELPTGEHIEVVVLGFKGNQVRRLPRTSVVDPFLSFSRSLY
jgi:hypothetical protein